MIFVFILVQSKFKFNATRRKWRHIFHGGRDVALRKLRRVDTVSWQPDEHHTTNLKTLGIFS